jgi:hypothetical protein
LLILLRQLLPVDAFLEKIARDCEKQKEYDDVTFTQEPG